MHGQTATSIIQGIHVHGYYSPNSKDPKALVVTVSGCPLPHGSYPQRGVCSNSF